MIYALSLQGSPEDIPEIRVLDWHGQPGRYFEPGDLVVELETHKVVIEARAERAAVLRRILVEPGEWRKLGAPLALLSDTEDEPLPESPDALAQSAMQFEIV